MPHTITVGCRVSAQVGPLERREGAKRRCKVRYIGTVLDSAPEKAWIVWWDDIHKCSSHSCRSLRFEGPTPRNFHVKMTARKIQQLIKKNFVTDPSSVPLGNSTATPLQLTQSQYHHQLQHLLLLSQMMMMELLMVMVMWETLHKI